ncbi:MAG TPA: PEP-CTERM sorting domain-containing protein [Telluria sp.]|nr:PEP-CTERM sorting domain-containing protein [Telluria sp.]
MPAKLRCLKLSLLPLFGAPLLVQAAPVYSLTALGMLPGSAYSQPLGMNNHGDVVGRSIGAQSTAYLYAGGAMTSLGTLGGSSSQASGINDAGTAAGYSTLADNTTSRAFRASGGTLTALGTLGGADSYGTAINNAGMIAGSANTADNALHAVTWTGAAISDLGTLGGAASAAAGINDTGMVTGTAQLASGFYHAFQYAGGVMQDLGTLGGTASDAWAINATGAVTGYSYVSGDTGTHAFLYSAGMLSDLGTLGGADSYGYGINGAGSVVGGSIVASGDQHAFIYSAGVITDLNSLIDPSLGLTLTFASAINDSGQIAAEACGANGQRCQSVLLSLDVTDPNDVPEPASFTAVAAALGLAGMMRRRTLRRRR